MYFGGKRFFRPVSLIGFLIFVVSSVIIYYKAITKDEEFKVDWKKVDGAAREKFKLKFIYARGTGPDGHLAVSSLRLKKDILAEMSKT